MAIFFNTEMEICQEDFGTQEVPAGFDFASYGKSGKITLTL